jgi:deoxyribonuclease I
LKKTLILFILICLNLYSNSFSKSKKLLLKKVYYDNQYTFYCSNPYEIKEIDGKEKTLIIKDKKYFTSKDDSFFNFWDENIRSKRVEWDHVMPVERFARDLLCWKSGGRKACKNDISFNEMKADMHNLVPSIGEINNDKSNYKFADKTAKKRLYGNCEFEIDSKSKEIYVKDNSKGDIARIYLYMSDKYNIPLSKTERKMMEEWNIKDPTSTWEKIKNERVFKLQGNRNSFFK